jgi:3-oxoacyl-[acyl-carrier-protein] synthase-3
VFEGQEIFKRAVTGMGQAAAAVMGAKALTAEDIDLVVPHQANLRIIEAVAKRAGIPMERVFVNVQRYGNMSAATVPVALVEALEAGRVRPGAMLLLPAFGAGLTWCAHLVRWGERVKPLGASEAQLPPCDRSALDMVRDLMARRDAVPSAASR